MKSESRAPSAMTIEPDEGLIWILHTGEAAGLAALRQGTRLFRNLDL
jgi:hypothetical protein